MENKVKTIVLKVSDKTKEEMVKYFDEKKRPKTPDYALFQADEADTVVTMYNSNKVVFQGISADIDANMWNEFNKNETNMDCFVEKKKKEEKKEYNYHFNRYNTIGSDEVGTGDYFGPIVVTASYVSKDNVSFLVNLGVKDSKKMSDSDILMVVPKILKKIPYHTFVLNNKDYNHYNSNGYNMNKIKAILHNKALKEIYIKNFPYDYIVVDQFCYPKNYFQYINESSFKVKNITFTTKAEDKCLSVACSSLISRYIFIKEMEKISNDLQVLLPKGASKKVDEIGKEIVKRYGKDKLSNIAKLNFKNTDRILKEP
ncbi:MAG: ribonuclease HIII [bacterium]|nr:ribonuclease HIII [bacterium]